SDVCSSDLSELKSGDKVEIFTSKDANAGPSRDWQEFLVSPRAKAKVRQWFAKERREEHLKAGRDALASEVQRGGLPMHRLFTATSMKQVAEQQHFDDVDSLYTTIGAGHVCAQHVANQLMALFGDQEDDVNALASRTPLSELESSRAKQRQQTADSSSGTGILVEGSPDILAKLAKCCQPVPGDEIF